MNYYEKELSRLSLTGHFPASLTVRGAIQEGEEGPAPKTKSLGVNRESAQALANALETAFEPYRVYIVHSWDDGVGIERALLGVSFTPPDLEQVMSLFHGGDFPVYSFTPGQEEDSMIYLCVFKGNEEVLSSPEIVSEDYPFS